MRTAGWPTTREIGEIFAEEIAAAGGRVSDKFDDGSRLFLRAVLPGEREVRPGDRVQGGVALRATPEEISVHPYVFRQVCSNGAIRARALESREIRRAEFESGDELQRPYELIEAVRACCSEAAQTDSAREMRLAAASEMDAAVEMMSLLARMAQDLRMNHVVTEIHDQYFKRTRNEDRSQFAFMNVVTAAARDQRDPEVRWRLEEFGGRLPVAVTEHDFEPVATREKVETVLLRA
jgi:hypothetical protein